MALLSPAAVITSSPSEIPLSQVISDELSAVRKNRAGLMTDRGNSRIHIGILLLCVGINVMYFLYRHDYLALFIAASFYLNMYYFIILLIPQNVKKNAGLPNADLASSAAG